MRLCESDWSFEEIAHLLLFTQVASRLVLDTKGWALADDDDVVGDPTNTFNMKRRHLSHAESVISYT